MTSILNISAYRFVALRELDAWRESIRSQAASRGLRGTVLLASEGINLFLAGRDEPVRAFMAWLHAQEPFVDLVAKESRSSEVPFGKLLVKVKGEIIRMNRPTIRPEARRAPAVDPATVARWLDRGTDDAGRPVVMLDTRNAFEIEQGRFRGALDWRIDRFSDFPRALAAHRADLKGKTVVSYCTGGIRCEKAALLMEESGIEHVLQLDGGILKYLEEIGARHFDGGCFVFDARALLDDTLSPAIQV